MAALVIGLVALIGGVALGSGSSPLSWFDRFTSDDPPATEVAQNLPAQTDDAAALPDATTEDPAASGDSDEASGESNGPDPNAPAVSVDPTETPLPTAQPTTENDVATRSPTDVVTAFLQRWMDGDYDGMYDLLTAPARATTTRQEFIDRYEGIASEAGITEVDASLSGEATLETQVPIHVKVASSYLGEIEQDNTVQARQEDDHWLIDWTPSLIFAGLEDGCIDYTEIGSSRGSILDTNGVQLAYEGI
ncbi:MAG: hypothetical protein KC438_10680, partial [Thermomicrobiales bacterium]|nr:hypothetical protein [Thermomicrobiales bacterium]